jgi:hypothetical protein
MPAEGSAARSESEFAFVKSDSAENRKVSQNLERILRKIEKFCGTFGFSAEDLDFLQKIGNFCGKTETSAEHAFCRREERLRHGIMAETKANPFRFATLR